MANRGPRSHGALFHAKEKQSENAPDAKGTVNITPEFIEWLSEQPVNEHGSVVVDIAAWKKTGPRAGSYLSVTLSERMQPAGGQMPQQKAKPVQSNDEWEDEIPF